MLKVHLIKCGPHTALECALRGIILRIHVAKEIIQNVFFCTLREITTKQITEEQIQTELGS